MNKKQVLEEILGNHRTNDYARKWVEEANVDESSLRETYAFLKSIGLSDSKIAINATLLANRSETLIQNYQGLSALGISPKKITTCAYLLAFSSETLERNQRALSELGLKDEKIAGHPELLARDPESLRKNHARLLSLGLKSEKIATNALLIAMNPETIERNYRMLSSLGLSDEKIASHPELLGLNPKKISENYQNHIGLLREDYTDRSSGRNLLLKYVQLIGTATETMEANVQFLSKFSFSYNPILLGTTTKNKREKMAWILREVFDYRNVSVENRRQTIEKMYEFIKSNPKCLAKSIGIMEKDKSRLRERASKYN